MFEILKFLFFKSVILKYSRRRAIFKCIVTLNSAFLILNYLYNTSGKAPFLKSYYLFKIFYFWKSGGSGVEFDIHN